MPPAMMRIRRPFRSAYRPASGWQTRTIGLTAATARATPKLPTPRSSVRIDGHDREQHPDGHAQRELRQHREHERLRQDAVRLHRAIQADRIGLASRQERRPPTRTSARCPRTTHSLRAQSSAGSRSRSRLLVLVVLITARARQQVTRDGSCSGFPWWIWLVLGAPGAAPAIDLCSLVRGNGLVQYARTPRSSCSASSRPATSCALGILVAGLVVGQHRRSHRRRAAPHGVRDLHVGTSSSSGSSSGKSRTAGRSPGCANTNDDGGRLPLPAGRRPGHRRSGSPQVWDYLYVSLTNSIAFSPTDTMPLSLRAKALMGLESFVVGGDRPPRGSSRG